MIASHNLFDSVGWSNPLWSTLHSPGLIIKGPHMVFAAYPLIPWIGVTAVGYSLGKRYAWPSARRRSFLLSVAVGLTAAFVILRAINVYGDPQHWTPQRSAAFAVLSFLKTNKYPPSLQFLLMPLGPALLLLWAVDARTPQWPRPALIIGTLGLLRG
jgi:uncharacterized membrane protein